VTSAGGTAGTPTGTVAGVDPRAVAGSVLACAGVVRLSGGPYGGAGTYLPGGRVTGVVVREAGAGAPDVAVHVVALAGTPVAEVAAQVRSAVAAAAPGSRVDVHVEDVDTAPPAGG
jgi:uncharacterized alkaline shock family protein YloU